MVSCGFCCEGKASERGGTHESYKPVSEGKLGVDRQPRMVYNISDVCVRTLPSLFRREHGVRNTDRDIRIGRVGYGPIPSRGTPHPFASPLRSVLTEKTTGSLRLFRVQVFFCGIFGAKE